MAESILTPGLHPVEEEIPEVVEPQLYLLRDNFLDEYKEEWEKTIVREHLGILAAEDTYTKEEVEPIIIEKVKAYLAEKLDESGFITEENVRELISNLNLVNSKDISNFVTKSYVDKLIQACLTQQDKTKILDQVTSILLDYVKNENVYTKKEVYTKNEIDDKISNYVKRDGSTPFTAPQIGRTPQTKNHLTTKGYVDDLLETHKSDIDPHNFTEKLNNKLKKYALLNNVFDKTQTYSRSQIDSIINKLVSDAVKETVDEYPILQNPETIIENLGFVLKNGTTPFIAPQKGVDAKSPNDLVTLQQLESKSEELLQSLEASDSLIWKTSGPVETTVGFVEDNTLLQSELTLQEIMDAIFYGKSVSISVPDYVGMGDSCDITVCIHGSTASVDHAELWQGDKLIEEWNSEQLDEFVNGCVTVSSEEISEDTEFTFKVYYTNGTEYEASDTVKVSLDIFAGLFPYWKAGTDVTWSDLKELVSQDPKNNAFFTYSDTTITMNYQFVMENEMKKPVVIIPDAWDYELDVMSTKSQFFELSAFDIVTLPMQVKEDQTVVYRIYIFKQPQAFANQNVTFNFKSKSKEEL